MNIDQASLDVARLIRTKKPTKTDVEAMKLLCSSLSAITTVFLSDSENGEEDAIYLWRTLKRSGLNAFWQAYIAIQLRDDIEEGENIIQQLGPDPTFGDLHVLIARSQQQI